MSEKQFLKGCAHCKKCLVEYERIVSKHKNTHNRGYHIVFPLWEYGKDVPLHDIAIHLIDSNCGWTPMEIFEHQFLPQIKDIFCDNIRLKVVSTFLCSFYGKMIDVKIFVMHPEGNDKCPSV